MLVIGDVTGRGARAASVTAAGPLHAAHRRGADRRSAGRARDPEPRPAGPRRRRPLQRRRAGDLRRTRCKPVRLAVAGHPPPLLVDGEAVDRDRRRRPGARRLHRRRLGARLRPWSSPASSSSSSPTGSPRPGARTAASARSGCGRSSRGAASPVQAVQRLEGALAVLHRRHLDDDVAILALAPASADGPRPAEPLDRLRRPVAGASGFGGGAWMTAAESWSSASSTPSTAATWRRSSPSATRSMEFFAVTAERGRPRRRPTSGRPGLRAYLERRRDGLGGAADHPQARSSRTRRLAAGPRPRLPAQPRARHPRHAGRLDLGAAETAASSAARSSSIPEEASRALQPRSSASAASRSAWIGIDDSTPVIFEQPPDLVVGAAEDEAAAARRRPRVAVEALPGAHDQGDPGRVDELAARRGRSGPRRARCPRAWRRRAGARARGPC